MTAFAALAVAGALVMLGVRMRPSAVRAVSSVAPAAGEVASGGVLAVLEDVERDLRSGIGLLAAVRTALGRRPSALPSVRRDLESGARLREALSTARPKDPAEVLAVQTLRACEQSGGAMGSAVERAVMVLRERQAWDRERRVHAAQARLSATVLTLVPLVFAAWGAATSSRIRRAYIEIPACAVAAVVGVVINLGGWLWMRRLVAGAAR